ncbi:hypothetical protein [Pararcticibacter amylolyticus]|uniref:Uncharacterized protein n=1 Tax=Pararcticibacter amylolyticus TaxID=2173175 RepID=A0A2U2PLR8_9SPHI|nr:hypothetical protein [Pararcticibacter amylolyticus]PWG82119.1 hypothetical protein DDR33_03635 [Pararcticibacter amylolyticus]
MKAFYKITIFFILSSCNIQRDRNTSQNKHLSLTGYNHRYELGHHLELKDKVYDRENKTTQDTDRYHIFSDIGDDRDVFSKYRYEEKIMILKEYLRFRGDTSISNKRYEFIAASLAKHPPNYKKNFTVEIEALFSFTRMLTTGNPPLIPLLIENKTGKVINQDRKKVNEVFLVYERWLQDCIKNSFKIIDYPLNGKPYSWMGQEKAKPYLKTAFR